MRNDRAPNEQTPDQQRAARDKRWAKARRTHWHSPAQPAPTQPQPADDDRARGSKPTDIPSRAPGDSD